jgi:hypothetical protein
MSITLTIEAMTANDLMEQIEGLAVRRGVGRFNVDEGAESAAEEQAEAPTTSGPSEGEDNKPKRKRRTKAEIEADKVAEAQQSDPQPEPEQPASEAPKPEASKSLEGFAVPNTVDDLRNILRTIASTKSPQAAAGVLTELQYTKVSDVPKEKYAEFAALADKAVA